MNNNEHPMDEQFRSSFEGFRAAPTAGLWARIESALPADGGDADVSAFDEEVQGKMAGLQVPPSAELWARIESALPTHGADADMTAFDEEVQHKMAGLQVTPSAEVWPRIAPQLPFSLLLRQHLRSVGHIALGAAVVVMLFWGYEWWRIASGQDDAKVAEEVPAIAAVHPPVAAETVAEAVNHTLPTQGAEDRVAVWSSASTGRDVAPTGIRRKAAVVAPAVPVIVSPASVADEQEWFVVPEEATERDTVAHPVPVAGRMVPVRYEEAVPAWWMLPVVTPLSPLRSAAFTDEIAVASALTGAPSRMLDGLWGETAPRRVVPQGGWSVEVAGQLNNTWLLGKGLLESVGAAASYAVNFEVAPSIGLLYATDGNWRYGVGLTYARTGQRFREILDGKRMTTVEGQYWQVPITAAYRLPVPLARRDAALWASAGVVFSGAAALPTVRTTLDGMRTDAPADATLWLADQAWGTQLGLCYERPLSDRFLLVTGATAQLNSAPASATWWQVGAMAGLQYRIGR